MSDGAGGGTYGGGGSNNDPLADTGMTQGQLQQGTVGGGGNYVNLTALPTDQIFIGAKALGRPAGTRGHDSGRYSGFTTYQNAQQLVGQWYMNDPSQYKSLVNKMIMYKVGGITADSGLPEVASAWDDMLQMAIGMNKAQGKKLKTNWTPWDILESYNRKPGSMGTHREGDWLIDIATGEKVRYVGPRTKTTKQSAVDLSNSDQVQAIAMDALTKLIGRAPTTKEIAKFKATLNGYEQAHPEVTTSTEHYDDMGNVTATDVSRSGGVDDAARASLIGSGVQKTKEYGKYQSGTTYFNALMQMIGGG